MRFMFGQALAGAARRGSQRLQELEQRAQTITDRATQRFLNQHDKWQEQYDADKRAYTQAYQSLNNVGIELSDAQKEMILLGGPEGAKKFAEAYKNDIDNQAYNYSKEQAKKISYEAGRETTVPKPKFKYTDEMKQAFLGKVFQRSDDYEKLVGQGDEKGLADLGLGIKKASALYAQGLNPYRDIEESMKMTAQTEEEKNRSMSGLGIPASYLQSGIRDQLSGLGIVKPEEITDAELGVGTGWKAPVYDLIDTETLIKMHESVLSQEKSSLSMKATIQEMEFNKSYNATLMKIKLKEYAGMDEEQRRVALQNDNLELQNAYDKIKLNPINAQTIQDLEKEALELSIDLQKDQLNNKTLKEKITNAHAHELLLKNKLMATTDPKSQQLLSAQIKQVQGTIQQHLILQKTLNAVNSDMDDLAPLYDMRQTMMAEAMTERGHTIEQTDTTTGGLKEQIEGTSQEIRAGRKVFHTEQGSIYQDENPELYNKIKQEVRNEVDFKFVNMLTKVNDDGTFTAKMPDNEGVSNFLSLMSFTNTKDYQTSVIKRVTDAEFLVLKDAIIDGQMPTDQLIAEFAEANQMEVPEATNIVTNLQSMFLSEQEGGKQGGGEGGEDETETKTRTVDDIDFKIKNIGTNKNVKFGIESELNQEDKDLLKNYIDTDVKQNYEAYKSKLSGRNKPITFERYRDLQLRKLLKLPDFMPLTNVQQEKLDLIKNQLGL